MRVPPGGDRDVEPTPVPRPPHGPANCAGPCHPTSAAGESRNEKAESTKASAFQFLLSAFNSHRRLRAGCHGPRSIQYSKDHAMRVPPGGNRDVEPAPVPRPPHGPANCAGPCHPRAGHPPEAAERRRRLHGKWETTHWGLDQQPARRKWHFRAAAPDALTAVVLWRLHAPWIIVYFGSLGGGLVGGRPPAHAAGDDRIRGFSRGAAPHKEH